MKPYNSRPDPVGVPKSGIIEHFMKTKVFSLNFLFLFLYTCYGVFLASYFRFFTQDDILNPSGNDLFFIFFFATPLFIAVLGLILYFLNKGVRSVLWICSILWLLVSGGELSEGLDSVIPNLFVVLIIFIVAVFNIVFLIRSRNARILGANN